MTIAEMIARQQELVNAAREAGRSMTPEETEEFDGLQRQINEARPTGGGQEGGGNPGGSEEIQRAVEAERQRTSDITALCRQTGMDPDQYIRSGATMDQVREAAVTYMLEHGAPVNTGRGRGRDEGDNFRQAAVDSLLMRSGVPVEHPTEEAEQLRSLSLRDMAIECMAREGVGSTTSLLRMGKEDLWNMACRQFYNPTSAFPSILDSAIKKSIVHEYNQVPTTFQLWTGKGSLTDFKSTKDHRYLIGGAGEFERVGETGELKSDTPKDHLLPSRQLDTYGRQFSMTRQAFINDDVGFITEVPGLYASSAKRTINKQVYEILMKNPTIFDGVPLFDDAHSNMIAAGCKPSNEAIQAMMMKMMLQKDPFGENIMVQPGFLILPVGYGFLLTTILESPTLNTTDNTQAVNPLYKYRDRLKLVEEAAINGMAGTGAAPWFMVADKASAKSIQVDYLNGQETPTIRRSEKPGQLGFIWDIWLDWGISVMDWRGINKNPGAAL